MNFEENDLWRDKTKLLNLTFSKLYSAKVLLKLKFDTKDQVLFIFIDMLEDNTDNSLGQKDDCPPFFGK